MIAAFLVSLLLAGAPAAAQNAPAGMPDPRQMSGIPLPSADVAPGTITVRVIKGSLANVIPNQPVELQIGTTTRKANTDAAGRASFEGVPPGTRVKAFTQVAGERLESQEFQVPATGGIRVMLVAADPEAATRAAEDRALAQAPAQPGTVVLGDQSRFVIELSDDALSVFNLLQILNTARTPVETQPLVFELPPDAEGAAVLEGSSPQATAAGRRITVTGPFAPGATLVQFAYSLPYSGDRVTIEQRLPAQLTRLTVLAQKVGETHLASPQIANHRDLTAEGRIYIAAQGPAIKAGDTLSLAFTGLPHAATWPRNVAIGLAVVILAAGVWFSVTGVRGGAAAEGRRKKLESRRDRLFSELTSLEEQHRTRSIATERYAARRRDLLTALERIYAEIDEDAAA
jgi:hypothetical protein